MMRNRDYPLYEREEYETLSQMVRRKAQECGDKIAFQYRQGKTIHSVTYNDLTPEQVVVLVEILEKSKLKENSINRRGRNQPPAHKKRKK